MTASTVVKYIFVLKQNDVLTYAPAQWSRRCRNSPTNYDRSRVVLVIFWIMNGLVLMNFEVVGGLWEWGSVTFVIEMWYLLSIKGAGLSFQNIVIQVVLFSMCAFVQGIIITLTMDFCSTRWNKKKTKTFIRIQKYYN